MPIYVRLEPEIERLLDEASRQERKSRSALIHDAVAAFLKRRRPSLGDALRRALADAPGGLGIEREQPASPEVRISS